MKPIKEMDLNELKALAYDLIGQFEVARNNLNVVNAEIELRSKEKSLDKEETDK